MWLTCSHLPDRGGLSACDSYTYVALSERFGLQLISFTTPMARAHSVGAISFVCGILYFLAFYEFISVPLVDKSVSNLVLPVVRYCPRFTVRPHISLQNRCPPSCRGGSSFHLDHTRCGRLGWGCSRSETAQRLTQNLWM